MARPQNHSSHADPALPLRQRLAALEQQLIEERGHHDQSRRQLEQAQRLLAELEARTQRVTLDQADEMAAEQQATMRAQRELEDLRFERDRLRQEALPATTQAAAEPEPAKSRSKPSASPTPDDAPARKPRARSRLHAAPEPKPVRWWTPSYRAGAKGKR